MGICTCICIRICTCICISMCICMCVHIYIYAYVHKCDVGYMYIVFILGSLILVLVDTLCLGTWTLTNWSHEKARSSAWGMVGFLATLFCCRISCGLQTGAL